MTLACGGCGRVTGPVYDLSQCRLCWLAMHDARYAEHWGLTLTGAPAYRTPRPRSNTVPLPCVHLGAITYRCPAGNELLHNHECDHPEGDRHGDRGIVTRRDTCSHCPHYQAIHTRHLLYHVWPVRGRGIWQLNIDRLLSRVALFNGRRVIAVAVGPGTDTADAVREYVRGHGFRVLEFENDPALREVRTFHRLWEQVEDFGRGHATFYGHAKGVRHPHNRGVTVHAWTRLMYEACLDHWPHVSRLLGEFPVAGPFLRTRHFFAGSRAEWHYSGSFYWVRNDAVQAANWREIDWHWWGIESWPGLHWGSDQAAVIFGEEGIDTHDLNLYTPAVCTTVEGRFRPWSQHYRAT